MAGKVRKVLELTFLAFVIGCAAPLPEASAKPASEPAKNPGRVIQVVVALCDNKYQGIVPVPARIGNGDDPKNNLYWGSSYGVDAFFRNQKDWERLPTKSHGKAIILDRVVFKNKRHNVYLVADAYRGREIKQATIDFLGFAAGRGREFIEAGKTKLIIGGGADMIAFVGHDGLMDFHLDEALTTVDEVHRDAVILACKSRQFFTPALRPTGARPLLWTNQLMAPEAYVLKAAVDGWIAGDSGSKIKERAAQAYDQYQRCGIKGARNTFATGW